MKRDNLDFIDVKILNKLQENGRTTNVELSDFVFSAIIDEDSFNADYNKNSSIIQKSTVGSSQFVWFIQNQLDIKSNEAKKCKK